MTVPKWIWPLVLVSTLIFVLSLRQLSDPDLGFHLKYGKWIVINHQVPGTDQSTYTVAHHPYVDMHWLFQVAIYGVFRLAGYHGISVFFCLAGLALSLLLAARLHGSGIPVPITSISLLMAFLIIEPRIAPRPEMFTFLFLTLVLMILDLYALHTKNMLHLLPFIMLLWCNMHALFVVGLFVMAAYCISYLVQDMKTGKAFLKWTVISLCICFINPYGIKGFWFPVELLSRFDPGNIYHQHIQEFIPFFAQQHFVLRDYLFMLLLGVCGLSLLVTRKHCKPHHLALVVVFGALAIASIRNIPLFVLVAVPMIGRQVTEISLKTRRWHEKLDTLLYALTLIVPLALIPRLLTNDYYIVNNSFIKTGTGINTSHQPANAADFLVKNHLGGRILNSIGFGGWLSWAIPQPVFIDGRLEVMQEQVYREVTESWKGGLPSLIAAYRPQLIVYNYLKYYPWTLQLKNMSGWRLIYADGIAVIFAREDYAKEIPAVSLATLPETDFSKTRRTWIDWLNGFCRQTDYASIDRYHLGLLKLQLLPENRETETRERAVGFFNSANLRYDRGDIRGALADYDSAIMLEPRYYKAFNNRGILRATALKDYSGAIADFGQAIQLNPAYGDAYLGRGTAYFFLHNIQAACRDWKNASLLGNPQAARLIGMHCNR